MSNFSEQINETLIYVGQKLRTEREKLHITREHMELITEVSVDTIKRIESGKPSSIENVLKIAAALHVPFSLLFPAPPRDKHVIRQEIDKLLDELSRY